MSIEAAENAAETEQVIIAPKVGETALVAAQVAVPYVGEQEVVPLVTTPIEPQLARFQ